MPLIIITGLPCSGKTYRTQQIASYFEDRLRNDPTSSKRKIHVVNSYHASVDLPYQPNSDSTSDLRDKIYNSAAQEKTSRAEEFSNIKRAVSKDTIVIADGLNYIKGYRYQLWCEAKAARTRCCVVHVAAQEDECQEWNRERLRAWGRQNEIETSKQDQQTQKNAGSKQGKDVLGDLVPESHTAVYGDRVIEKISQSRSSSTDGQESEDQAANSRRPKDTMTLKSLYITDRTDPKTHDPPPIPTASSANAQLNPPSLSNTTALPTTPVPPPSSSPPYSPSTLSSLQMRYEPPSPFSRWDTPLFTVPTTDAHPPYEAIYLALFPSPAKPTSKKALAHANSQAASTSQTTNGTANDKPEAVKQHAATVLPPATSADALQMIESATLDVVKALLACARTAISAENGDEEEEVVLSFSLPVQTSSTSGPMKQESNERDSAELIQIDLPLPPNTILNQPMLQRLRRKYTAMQRGGIAHGQGYVRGGKREVVEGFVRFLDAELNG